MAMFGTHLGAAVVGGTVFANAGYAVQVWGGAEILPVIALVVIGGLLPDIDAKQSHSVTLVFAVFGILAMVAVSFSLRERMALLPALVCSTVIYLAVRHGAFHLFNLVTIHRGNAHSLIAGVFVSVMVAALTHQISGTSILAWVYGMALMFGVLIHLTLDELYSVDISGARLKKSFGTALKPIDMNNPLPGLIMLVGSLVMLPALPPLRDVGLILARFAEVFA